MNGPVHNYSPEHLKPVCLQDVHKNLMLRTEQEKGHLTILSAPLPASSFQSGALPLPLQPPLLLLLRLHVQRLVPSLLAFRDVEVEHPLAVPPVQPEQDGQEEDEQQDEGEGEHQPVFDGSLKRRNAHFLLIPEKQSFCSDICNYISPGARFS